MKQETNKEIDLLLRRLSRRRDDFTSDAGLSTDEEHLDADELSSYVENAVPAAARARYTAHLAECSSCRGLIVQLSSSVGVVAAPESSRASEPSGLRTFLASLFSPMVLRYAVPALGLIVVAVIGIGIWRRGSSTELAMRSAPVGRSETPVAKEQSQTPTQDLSAESKEKVGSPAATPQPRANKALQAEPVVPNAPPSVSVTTDIAQNAPAQKKPEEQPSANAAAAAPPAPAPAAAMDQIQRMETAARKRELEGRIPPGSQVARQRASEPAKEEDRRSDEVAATSPRPAKSKAESSDSKASQTGGATAKLQRDGIEEKDKDDAETRSVAGRRFRKLRGIWIDTAYESSKATMNLTRGSEQYRALVADEPSIKTIAEQLDGEVVVVWKGRAYRIR